MHAHTHFELYVYFVLCDEKMKNADYVLIISVFTDLSNVRGLAIDWLSRNMYWMSSDNDETHINVARLDGSLKTTVVHGMDKPKCLVLHPSKG